MNTINDYCLLPIENYNLYKWFIEQQNVLWKQSEIRYEHIVQQWNELSSIEKHIAKHILALFAQLDNVVSQSISISFINRTTFKDAKVFYAIQEYVETVHAFAYAEMIMKCITDPSERITIFESVKNFPSIKIITTWVKKFIIDDGSEISYLKSLIILIALEGIIFIPGFVFILWLKDRNKLEIIGTANEWILRDEKIHTEFGITLYKETCKKIGLSLTFENVINIFKEAIEVSEEWINDVLPHHKTCIMECSSNDDDSSSNDDSSNNDGSARNDGHVSLCKIEVINYIKCITDEILKNLGYPSYYRTSHKCHWMLKSTLNVKTNFFERQVTNYSTPEHSTIEISEVF